MKAAHTRGTRLASVHAQASKTSKVKGQCTQPAMQWHAAMQSAKAERRLINAEIKADQKLNVRRRRSKMAASELGQPLV